ncbi:MAG: CRTAC1 family protein [Acidobacteria bacterium]|nr:MAG: CRTAC1 family protein [Acidobacteriota bacterium]
MDRSWCPVGYGAASRSRQPRGLTMRVIASGAVLLLWAMVGPLVGQQPPPTMTDVTTEAGIAFRHNFGDDDLSNIVEGTGPGGMFFDYNNDDHPDIYLLNGSWLGDVSDNRSRALRGKLSNALYRNNKDGTFTEVTAEAGVGDQGYGMGASAADFDDDGDLDLLVLNYGPNVFYRNNGDGTFTDITVEAGLGDPLWSVSAPWLDYDGDGDLDVYVANYLEYDAGSFRDFYAAQGYPGPLAYKGQPDHLYRNNGDGTFTDVTEQAGLLAPGGRAMSAVAADLDRDGDTDIYVANDAMSSAFWVNQAGRFEDQALERGLAFGEGGQGASSMGPVVGDFDRNGLFDIYVPDMGYGCLLSQREEGMFFDVTAEANLAMICGQYTGWGGGLVDFDNDGYLDAFVANGNAHHLYTEEDVLARNDRNGRFEDVAKQAGGYFQEKYVGRGAAFADYDNDGDVDILVMNLGDAARLLRNDGGNRNNWLTVVPRRAAGKQVAIGAEVTVRVGSLQMIHPVHAVSGYLSSGDPRAHFGLGAAEKADLVEIRWPDGELQRLEDVEANQILEVTRGAR